MEPRALTARRVPKLPPPCAEARRATDGRRAAGRGVEAAEEEGDDDDDDDDDDEPEEEEDEDEACVAILPRRAWLMAWLLGAARRLIDTGEMALRLASCG